MISEPFKLFSQLAVTALISVFLVNRISSTIVTTEENSTTKTDLLIDSRLNGGTLEVKPSIGEPVPLSNPLQSPRGQSDQQAQGDLQQPRRASDLQPTGGIDDAPNGSL